MEHESRSWWTEEQRDRLERFHAELSSQVGRTLGWTIVLRRLRNMFPSLTIATLENWQRRGTWDPRVLYEACKMVDYDPWEAALAIGALPDDATGMERALDASTVLAIERYYQTKRDAMDGLPALAMERLTAALPHYHLQYFPMERGRTHSRPYHTCLVFRQRQEPAEHELSNFERDAAREALRDEVDLILSDVPVCAHWERSDECKPPGCENNEVLIIESYFDNRPPLGNSRRWAGVAPVVVLGVHYSGAKDVGVEVARRLDLGSLDLGRYMGEVFRERLPFRREVNLQGQLFENVTSSLLGRRLVITVDDYEALERVEARRPGTFSGTAVVLLLDNQLLRYAAHRIWANIDPPDRPEVHNVQQHLAKAQASLERLAKHFEQRLPAELISCDAIVRNADGSYSDQVHDMFDTYMEAAKRIAAGLLRRRTG